MPTFTLSSITYIDLALVFVFVYVLARTIFRTGSSLSLPPGPRRVPFLGNLLSMPMAKEWETFAKWGEKYGDIVSVTVFSQTIVVLNSAKVAAELLDSRSAIYSDRPVVPMGGELVGYNRALGLLPYGDRFKKHRRLAKQLFGNTKTMEAFYPIEEEEAHRLLKRLVSQSDRFVNHIQKMAGAIILRVTHGYPVQEGEDPFVKLADEALQQFSASSSPTSFMVNMVPALMYVPAWVPGVSFKKTARKWAAHLEETVEKPFEWVKTRMANGTAEMSFISNLLGEGQLNEGEEYDIKWTALALYAAGVDTTVGSQVSFLKAMLLWPEVAKKAQAELDTVVGSDRLPTFADRASLPYLNALALETFRWHSVGPTGIAHRLMEDDTYNGYFIPKGSVIMANIWQMLHDPSTYPDPWVFKPERFLVMNGNEPQKDPRDLCFGFGRRICPGRVLADASAFISCAMILSVFNISPYIENGIPDAPPDMEQEPGVVSHPSKFRCSITPRSEKALSLILADERH